MTHSIQTVIIKVTNDCNLRCRYCFLTDSVVRGVVISPFTVELLLRELESYSSASTIDLVWHGGEPTIAGPEFFSSMKRLQKGFSTKFNNYIQTNGTLLTPEFIEILDENDFKIGLSLDGPASLNDRARVDRHGIGVCSRVEKTMEMLGKRDIPFGILATIAKHNIAHADELYSYCRSQQIPLKLSPLYHSGRAIRNMASLAITMDEYSAFLHQLAKLWLNDDEPVSINPLDHLFSNVVRDENSALSGCSFNPACHRKIIAIDPVGNLYPCGMFQGLNDFCYGNIANEGLVNITKTEPYKSLENRTKFIEKKCQPCQLFSLCYGGCPFKALTSKGELNEKTPECRPLQSVLEMMVDTISEKLDVIELRDIPANDNNHVNTHKEVSVF